MSVSKKERALGVINTEWWFPPMNRALAPTGEDRDVINDCLESAFALRKYHEHVLMAEVTCA